ncbi:MAG: SH3 domain-containing protein [Anaerolineae bacterium]|nr:SH3 domain-containing protein [Anaerolineae bacterium]
MRMPRPFLLTLLIALCLALASAALAQYDPNAELPRPVNDIDEVKALPGYLIVNTDNLFLRSGDSARNTPVAILDGGTYLIVLGSNGREGGLAWWYVEVGGYEGWVKDEFVIVRGDLRGTPIVDSDGTLLSPALYVGYAAPLYDELTREGAVVCDITGDRFYLVLALNQSDATWIKVRATCAGRAVEGWVWAERGLLRNPAGVEIPVEG